MPKLPATFEDWTPPWVEKGTEFDADVAARLVYNLKREIEVEQEKANTAKADLQAKLDAAIKERDEKASKVNELEDEKITDERERERVQFKREMDELKQLLLGDRAKPEGQGQEQGQQGAGVTEADRLRAAMAAGLTEEDADRLRGDTLEELRSDAQKMAERLGIGPADDHLRYDGASDDGEMPSGVPARQGFRTDLGGNSGGQSFDPGKVRDILGRR